MGSIDPAVMAGGYKDYWDDLVKLVIGFIDRGVYVILCPWQYRPPSVGAPGNTDITYRGKSFESEHFADFWGKFSTAINNNVAAGFPPDPTDPKFPLPKFPPDATRREKLAFDLINEPHEGGGGVVGITVAKWKTYAQQAINAIRANPVNTNTIFVEGMGYASAHLDQHHIDPTHILWETLLDPLPLNNIAISAHCYDGTRILPGEAPAEKPFDALRTACKDLVAWARAAHLKVHIGEVAVDAGLGGCSDFAHAQSMWDDWSKFCLENDDVLVGWNWWGNTNTATENWGWPEEGSCKNGDPTTSDPNTEGGRHWALTRKDGVTPTVHADLIKTSIPVSDLYVRDNIADNGTEPNTTTTLGYESPDIWVRQSADGGLTDAPIVGGQPSVVYVRVTNRGSAAYPNDGNDVVALFWAKAAAGLACPEPWNGHVGGVVNPMQGGLIASVAIGAILPSQSKLIPINWPNTPNPADYPGNDGHFCLIAIITKEKPTNNLATFAFEDFECPKLNESVLKLNNVAWHNIHITAPPKVLPPGKMKLGEVVIANHTNREMWAQLAFEALDATAKPINPVNIRLLVEPEAAALEKLRAHQDDRPALEDLGHGTYSVLDAAMGIPHLDLRPGEALRFGLSYILERSARGYAVRAIQYAREGATRKVIGGQMFIAGEVAGFTNRRPPRHRTPTPPERGLMWPWVIAAGSLALLAALLGNRTKTHR